MSEQTVNPTEADESQTGPMFERYKFGEEAVNRAMLPGYETMKFVNLTHDVVAGAESLVDLLNWDDSRKDFDDQPLLSPFHRGNISRLVSTSLGLLLDE